MYALKQSDPVTWEFFKPGNFSVNKTRIAFSAIGADHAIEQENRAMKVLGGIKGIVNNEKALDQYFLIVPEMGNIVEEFSTLFNNESAGRKWDEHYQLTGRKNTQITENAKKLSKVFETHNTNFEDSDAVYNTITNKVLPTHLADQFLAHKEEGKKRL